MASYSSHKVLDKFIKYYIISVPLWYFGFKIGNFPFSIAYVFLSLISLYSLFRVKVSKKFFRIYFFLIVYVFFSILLSNRIIEESKSFFLLSFLLFPFIFIIKLSAEEIVKYVKLSVTVSFLLVILDYLVIVAFDSSYFLNGLPFLMERNLLESLTSRVQSGFSEPAWYATFLSVSYIYIDYFDSARKNVIYKVLICVFILLSVSLSGIAILLSYLISKFRKRTTIMLETWPLEYSTLTPES